jgi:hypothetical protein
VGAYFCTVNPDFLIFAITVLQGAGDGVRDTGGTLNSGKRQRSRNSSHPDPEKQEWFGFFLLESGVSVWGVNQATSVKEV